MTDQLQPKPIHILLVDDDEDDRYLTREAFHQHYPSSRISFAEDGEDLLDFLNYEGPLCWGRSYVTGAYSARPEYAP